MGRGVAIPNGAVVVAYTEWEQSYEDYRAEYNADDEEYFPDENSYYDFEVPEIWRSNKEWFTEEVVRAWPSLTPCDRWEHNEISIVAENQLVEITVSEYSGLTALCITTREDLAYELEALAKNVAKQMEKKFLTLFGTYSKLGTFSNGESIYTKVG